MKISPTIILEHLNRTEYKNYSQTTDTLMSPFNNTYPDKTNSPQNFFYSSKTLSYTQKPNKEKKIHPKGGDDLYAVIRIPLLIGSWFGLIPILGLGDHAFHPDRQIFMY
jgi:hypothetical protein